MQSPQSRTADSLAAFDTEWPADTVEFCPHKNAINLFVCGTYDLEKPAIVSAQQNDTEEAAQTSPAVQNRRGKCLLFSVQHENDEYKLHKLQEVSLPAIPDVKWCHRTESELPALAVADTEGHVTLLECVDDDAMMRCLKQRQSIECASSEVLCLSLDWSNRRTDSSSLGSLVVSMSNGSIALLSPENGAGLSVIETWEAHKFEAWIAAWNYWQTSVIYTGGDDGRLKGWDIRRGYSQPIFQNRYDAGVTTIQSHPYVEHLIAVGRYDDTVNLYDVRKTKAPLVSVGIGGGAWRVKWHPSPQRKDDLLVACMHNGCRVVRFNEVEQKELNARAFENEVSTLFTNHKSMAYGADWSWTGVQTEKGTQESLIATCSFYDNSLHLWQG